MASSSLQVMPLLSALRVREQRGRRRGDIVFSLVRGGEVLPGANRK